MKTDFIKNKIVLIFWTILLLIFITFWSIVFHLYQWKAKAEEKIEKNKALIERVEKIEELSEKWRAFENEIIAKRELIEKEQNQLSLLENWKYEIEEQIHSIRVEFFWKKQ